ncbi:MAG: CPBP family intramembrane metalloprotease [Anaerolineae bacterium]|nr:CPBP family intramembrane metalloprotease [Anaerolineae bacterium]
MFVDIMAKKPLIPLSLAAGIIVVLWIGYTILYTLNPGDLLISCIEFLPGLVGIVVLWTAGFDCADCYLRPAPLSRKGLAWLSASMLFMPLIWLTGRWVGWDWTAILWYAPASGVSQELFFRSALLPVMTRLFKGRTFVAITIHAALFMIWHLPKVSMTAPLGGIVGVTVVTFVCGILWAKQVQHDGTIWWLVGYHSLILMINSLLIWE